MAAWTLAIAPFDRSVRSPLRPHPTAHPASPDLGLLLPPTPTSLAARPPHAAPSDHLLPPRLAPPLSADPVRRMHQATLRQRARKMNQATARLLPPSSSSSAAAAASLPSSKHPPKPQPPPNFLAQAHRRTARVRLVLSSLAILAVFVFAASSNRAGRPQLLRTPEGEAWVLGQLEREYAVCAPKAGGVFTAEGDGGAQGERCLVVSGSEIVELASLGPSCSPLAAVGPSARHRRAPD